MDTYLLTYLLTSLPAGSFHLRAQVTELLALCSADVDVALAFSSGNGERKKRASEPPRKEDSEPPLATGRRPPPPPATVRLEEEEEEEEP